MDPGRMAKAARAAALTCALVLVGWLAVATRPVPAGARTSAAAGASAAARASAAAILPPANPRFSVAVGRYLPTSCSGVRDFSSACMTESLGIINAGRQTEGLGPVKLPANWERLTVAQQLFVLTDLERTARGLPPDLGMSATLNTSAVAGADAGRDPSGHMPGFESLWAGGEPNPIVVMADWIYEDGLFADGFAENLNCSSSDRAGCWQHRDIVLHDGSSAASCGTRCQVGAGYSPGGYAQAAGTGRDSYAEVFARTAGGGQSFTWATELQQLPACERTGDSCGWSGSPVTTAAGVGHAGGPHSGPGSSGRPWFPFSVAGRATRGGHVTLRIHVGIGLLGVSAEARRGGRQVKLRVHRRSRYWYRAVGRLPSGAWTVTIRYRAFRGRRAQPVSRLRLRVP